MILLAMMIILGLLAEFFSAYLLMSYTFLPTVMMHGIANIWVAFSYKLFLTSSFEKVQGSFCLLMFLLGFFIPIFGIMISLFIVCSVYWLHENFHQYAEVLDESMNLDVIQPIYAQYGSGGASRHLLNEADVAVDRTKALFMLSQTGLSDINALMYQLLPDTSDEMRLLAFSILEEQESNITQKIEQLFSMLATDNLSANMVAQCKKNVALLYWELIYHHLISPEVEELILNKAQYYALAALKSLKNDAALWVLLGKIYKHLKQYDKAEEALQKAFSCKASPAQVLPYFAEIKYDARDYQAMQYYLNASDALLDIARIAPVKRFWGMP